jgi:hypothetical protein
VPRSEKKLNIFVGTVRPEGFLMRVTWEGVNYYGDEKDRTCHKCCGIVRRSEKHHTTAGYFHFQKKSLIIAKTFYLIKPSKNACFQKQAFLRSPETFYCRCFVLSKEKI